MPVTTDIAASYRGPRPVMRRLLTRGAREGRLLAILMAGCLLTFIAQWPRLAREAHLQDQALQPMLGGALMAWVFIMPLVFYLLAFLAYLVSRVGGAAQMTPYGARLALFWAFLAASPLMLLNGLVAGFIGPGPGLIAVGAMWLAVFLWFMVSNLYVAGWERDT